MTAPWVQHEVTTSPLHSAHAISPRSLFDPVVRELQNCRLRTFCELYRDCCEKVIMKAAETTAKRLEKRTWTVPWRRSGCGYFSDLGYRSRNKTPSKAVPRKELSMRWTMDDRLVRNTSSVILSKTWNLNKPLQREAVVFTIQTAAGHSLKRNATVGGRYHSNKLPGGDEISSRGKVKVPWWPKRRSLPS